MRIITKVFAVVTIPVMLAGCSGILPLQHGDHQVIGIVLQNPHTFEMQGCRREVVDAMPPTQFSRNFYCQDVPDSITWGKVRQP